MSENKEAPGTKHWLQMGVELEGSWYDSPSKVQARSHGAQWHKDLSVHIGVGNPGEIVTRPHHDLDLLIKDVEILWPDVVDNSCGFHIHTSFTPLKASLIATREFYGYFKDQWANWGKRVAKLPGNHEFWSRLAGKNKFAKDVFEPEKQLSTTFSGQRPEARYTMLNFYAWEKHQTVECRLLPMFMEKEIGISAIQALSGIYNTYLESHQFDKIVHESPIELTGDVVTEKYEVALPDTTPRYWVAEGKHTPVASGEGVFYSIEGAMDDMLPYRKITDKQTP